MKGGSVASDAVTGLVDEATFTKMNAMFDNKVGGACPCSGTQQRMKMKHRGGSQANANAKNTGNSSIANILGSSTMHAFGSLKTGGSSNTNAGAKLDTIPTLMSSDESLAMSVKNRQIGGVKRASKKVVGAKKKAPAKKAPAKKSSTRKVRRVQRGGADSNATSTDGVDVGPKLNFASYSFTPKSPPSSSAVDILASEGVSSIPLLQKQTLYGQVSSDANSPFMYGQVTDSPMKPGIDSMASGIALAGGRKKVAKKVTKKVAKKVTKVGKKPPSKQAQVDGKKKVKKVKEAKKSTKKAPTKKPSSSLDSLLKKLSIK